MGSNGTEALPAPPIEPDVHHHQNTGTEFYQKKKEHPLSSPWYKHQKRQLALIHDYQLIFRMHSSFAKKSIKFKKLHICPMTNDVNFEHMIKAFSARLLHYIFQTVSILGGGTFENIYSALHKHSICSFKPFIMNLCFSILIKMLSTTIFILMLQLSSFGQ